MKNNQRTLKPKLGLLQAIRNENRNESNLNKAEIIPVNSPQDVIIRPRARLSRKATNVVHPEKPQGNPSVGTSLCSLTCGIIWVQLGVCLCFCAILLTFGFFPNHVYAYLPVLVILTPQT